MVCLQRVADAALDVRPDDLLIDGFQQGLRRKQLIGDLHAIAVFLDHADDPIQLTARDFQFPKYAVVIGSHDSFTGQWAFRPTASAPFLIPHPGMVLFYLHHNIAFPKNQPPELRRGLLQKRADASASAPVWFIQQR